MRLIDWITREGITRRDFGARVGLSPTGIGDVCRGRVWVSAAVAKAIERETRGEVTVADLLAAYEGRETAA
jgi:DNA-binding transcriptional regulator YdaS (Cro superfamily)